MKKRSFTLIEVLVTALIVGMLLTLVLNVLSQRIRQHAQLQKVQHQVSQDLEIHAELKRLFLRLSHQDEMAFAHRGREEGSDLTFFVEYQNERNKSFLGLVKCRLFVHPEHHLLMLEQISTFDKTKREKVIATGVLKFTAKPFYLNSRDKKHTWTARAPHYIQISIKGVKNSKEWVFKVPEDYCPPIYI